MFPFPPPQKFHKRRYDIILVCSLKTNISSHPHTPTPPNSPSLPPKSIVRDKLQDVLILKQEVPALKRLQDPIMRNIPNKEVRIWTASLEEETEEGHSDNTLDYKQSREVRFKEETDKLNNSVAGADILKPDEENNHCILTSHTVNTS